MRLTRLIQQWLHSDPGRPAGRVVRLFSLQVNLWRHCMRRLKALNAMTMSAALSYRTIFAFIPLIVLVFLVIKAAGVLEDSKQGLRQVLQQAGLSQIALRVDEGQAGVTQTMPASAPTTGEGLNLAEKIESLVSQVEGKLNFTSLGPIGMVLMVWTALTLLITVERSLNRIFEAPRERTMAMRILVYWSMITLVPMVLIAVGFVGDRAIQKLADVPYLNMVAVILSIATNLAAGLLMIACVYRFMPNTPVSFRSALVGASVMVPLWLLARWGFGLYVTQVVGKGSLYGALGLLPLFLLWLSFCWYIFLLGGAVAHTSMNLRQMIAEESSENIAMGPAELLAAAIVVARHYLGGKGATSVESLATALGLPNHLAQRLAAKLEQINVVLPSSGGECEGYMPARPLDDISVGEVLDQGSWMESGRLHPSVSPEVSLSLAEVLKLRRQAVGPMTLKDLLRSTTGLPVDRADVS